ncbi:hypothetical protein [Novosphingopyxis sp.]|uniref:hypothetical protein n=1 Tax=Novosphingopyxis sp. TaxID=2709690 RepID=UPI003B5B0013
MRNLKKAFIGSAVGAAVLVSAAAPANAQYYRDRDRGGPSAGEVIAGVAILGGLAAVIAAASDNDRDRYDDRYNRYPNTNGYPTNGYDNGYYRGSAQYNRGSQAIQQCVQAAQYEGRRYGSDVRVTEVRDVDRIRSGVRVRGNLVVNEYDRRSRYGNRYDNRYRNNYDRGSFTCTIRSGRVVDVDINGI